MAATPRSSRPSASGRAQPGYPAAVADASRILVERDHAGVAIVEVAGEHDLNTVPELRHQLQALMGRSEAVVVDLGQATFVDSSVLAALLEARRRSEEGSGGFALVVPDGAAPGVRRVIEVTGLGAAIPVRPSREEAVATAREGAVAG